MGKPLSVACLTSDLLGGRSFSINHHLLLMVRGIIENFDIDCIDIYSHWINDRVQHPFFEIQSDFDIYLPKDKIRIIHADVVDYIPTAQKLAAYQLVFSQMYSWSKVLLHAKRMNPNLKIVSWVHSLLMQEFMANMQRKWVGFDNFLRMQKEILAVSDYLVFDSKYDWENGNRLHCDIIKCSTYIYPVPEINRNTGNYIDTSGIKKMSDIRLLFIGRWEYRKGIEPLVDCFFQCYAEFNMRLEILSDHHHTKNYDRLFHSPAIREKFNCLVDSGGIRMVNWKRSRREYLEYLKENFSVAVIPSLYDPFNIIAYDCITLGIPVVLSRFCGIEELVSDHSEMVVKVNAYDTEDIYRGILNLSDKIIQCSSIKIEKINYSIDDTISEFIHVLNQTLYTDNNEYRKEL